jgi:hypothetical protein
MSPAPLILVDRPPPTVPGAGIPLMTKPSVPSIDESPI